MVEHRFVPPKLSKYSSRALFQGETTRQLLEEQNQTSKRRYIHPANEIWDNLLAARELKERRNQNAPPLSQ